MSDRQYKILSTSSLPFERINQIPDSINIKIIPFIKIVPRTEYKIKTQINDFTAEKINVVFTSVHAVKSVKEFAAQMPDWKIYCIGKETRTEIENWLGRDAIAGSADNAKTLSEIIIAGNVNKAVFFCGNQRMSTLPENLKNQSIELTELIVYDTLPTPVKILDLPDAILFFSPTAVKSFFSMNELSSETTVFAMGTTTNAALKQFTGKPIIVSPVADKVFVLNMAVEYAVSHPIT
ncbi:MAG TPA: uroporphyrinogen-III synthase [Puia sp.]|jgi:uroporphyrinogen-III synthase|nr:uroporphyrinogen-III synthase [Puia sp.]